MKDEARGRNTDTDTRHEARGTRHKATELRTASQGFTLLELIIVIFLISLITGMSSLFFVNALPSRKFDATVRDISASIRHAKALASLTGEDQTLLIDMDQRQFGIKNRSHKKIPEGINIIVTDFLNQQFMTGEYPIVFHATGGVEGGTIALSQDKKRAAILIDPVVGAVTVR